MTHLTRHRRRAAAAVPLLSLALLAGGLPAEASAPVPPSPAATDAVGVGAPKPIPKAVVARSVASQIRRFTGHTARVSCDFDLEIGPRGGTVCHALMPDGSKYSMVVFGKYVGRKLDLYWELTRDSPFTGKEVAAQVSKLIVRTRHFTPSRVRCTPLAVAPGSRSSCTFVDSRGRRHTAEVLLVKWKVGRIYTPEARVTIR